MGGTGPKVFMRSGGVAPIENIDDCRRERVVVVTCDHMIRVRHLRTFCDQRATSGSRSPATHPPSVTSRSFVGLFRTAPPNNSQIEKSHLNVYSIVVEGTATTLDRTSNAILHRTGVKV